MIRRFDGTICFWGKGTEQFYGWSAEEALGKRSHELLKTVFPAGLEAVERSLLESGYWCGELTRTRRDGTVLVVASYWALHRDESGNPAAVIEIHNDITARKLAEEALQRINRKLAFLYEASKQWQHSRSEDYIRAMFERLSEQVGLEVYFYHSIPEGASVLKLASYSGVSWEHASSLHRLEFGEAVSGWVALQRRPLSFDNIQASEDPRTRLVRALGIQAYTCYPLLAGTRIIGTLSFGTRGRAKFTQGELELLEAVANQIAAVIDRTELTRELELRNRRLEQSNRELARSNEDLSRFAYAISHDLQEPVRTIKGLSELLLKHTRDRLAPDDAEILDLVVAGAERMSSLIQGLLAYSRVTAEQVQEPVDSNAVLDWVIANLQQMLDESGAVIEREPLPAARIGFNELAQVFQNLIGNAVKYRGESTPRIRIRATSSGGVSKFAVEDNGTGVPAEHRERIFGLFKRLAGNQIAGSGVGLAICKRIVERAGGQIWVESDPPNGSTFYFTVPN
jgi:PAS domain S-box-containing protein